MNDVAITEQEAQDLLSGKDSDLTIVTGLRCVLVMESHNINGPEYKKLLEEEGYTVTLVTTEERAMSLLNDKNIFFDLVLSGGLHWGNCYRLALWQYGFKKVVVYSVLPELVAELRGEGMIAFEKQLGYATQLSRTPEKLVEEIKKMVPL